MALSGIVYLRMEKRTLSFELAVFESVEALSPEDRQLLQQAKDAQAGAYAPYSHFKVGAAVLLSNGKVVIGSNQENASYPSGLCAERVAVFQAGAQFPGVRIDKIAITASAANAPTSKPAAPCGNCRQAIFEYEHKQGKPIELLLMGSIGEIYKCPSVKDLLPLAFSDDYLS